MGCWLGTCMITNLPIWDGEDIKVMILEGNELTLSNSILNTSGFCNSDDLLKPSFFAISGKYNDYGMIDNIVEDWNSNLILKHLKSRFHSIKNDDEEIIIDFTLIDFLEAIERGNLRVSNEGVNYIPFKGSWVMIKQSTWDGIVKRNKISSYKPAELRSTDYIWTLNEDLDYQFNKGMAGIDDPIDLTDFKSVFSRDTKLNSIVRGNFDDGVNIFVSQYYKDILLNNKELREDFKKQWFENRLVTKFVDKLRILWMPQSGAGSQSHDFDHHELRANIILEGIEHQKKIFDEY